MTINLKVPDLTELKPRITVFGVGGAGGNAVNNMITAGLEGCEFVVANTDAQALAMSAAERRIQMGSHITEGLGAGSKPDIGAAAADEAMADIKAQLMGSHMAFITAGMGGGTGTGAAPVIAKAAQEEDILTVGVVTKPFQFEGQRRMSTADAGIEELHEFVDTLIVIPNQNLFRVATEKTTFADAFALADEVLHSGVACITDLMVKEGLINLDFADVKAVMSRMGKAMMGTGESSGDQRALEAAEAAIANPLLDDVSMRGAKGLLISITGGNDMTLYEVDEAASRIREEVDENANIILGATFDENLEGRVRVSVVATGLDKQAAAMANDEIRMPAERKPAAEVKPAAEPKLAAEPMPAMPAKPAAKLTERIAKLDATTPAEPAKDIVKKVDSAVWDGAADVKIEKRPPQIATAAAAKAKSEPEKVQSAQAFVPQPPASVKRAPRKLPSIEDLPIVAQNELKARAGEAPEQGLAAQKKKVSFLERLAGVNRGRKSPEPEMVDKREPNLDSPNLDVPELDAQKKQPVAQPEVAKIATLASVEPTAPAPARTAAPLQTRSSPPPIPGRRPSNHDEEHLEIPAFLRRQAN
ncbi:MAG: cell division protein FtsZ [Methyloligellaceae bacterium]